VSAFDARLDSQVSSNELSISRLVASSRCPYSYPLTVEFRHNVAVLQTRHLITYCTQRLSDRLFTFCRAAVNAPMGDVVVEGLGSWADVVVVRTRRKLEFGAQRADGTAGCRVGNGFQTSNCRALVPGIQHAIIAGLVGCLLVGRPLARIRGEEGKDSKEGQELVVLEVQLR
jgi:hypothetical protein